MKQMTRFVNAVLTVGLAVAFLLSGCFTSGLSSYSAEPIEATVVDAETGQPLEGVNVVAHWQLEGGLEGGSNMGQMMVMEAVTDAKGVFRFPAWGPKRVPAGLLNARLTDKDPRMFIFKSGYQYRELINEKSMEETDGKGPKVRTSQWNAKVIPLAEYEGTKRKYGRHVSELGWQLTIVTAEGRDVCEWRKLPATISAMKREDQVLRENGIKYSTYYNSLISNEEFYLKNGCGSVEQYMKEHVP